MAQIKVEFSLLRDSKGYRLVGGQPPLKSKAIAAVLLSEAFPAGEPQRVARGGGKLDAIGPLDKFETLYRIFAEKARTAEGVLNFVQRYGSLTLEGRDPAKGDSVPLVIDHAQAMHHLLTAYATGGKKKLIGLLASPRPRISRIEVELLSDALTEKLELRLSVHSLIDGLWLQFGQAISGGTHLQQCQHCQELFETGPGSGRRLDAKFCSDEHRIAFNSHKRSEGKQ